MPHGQPTLKTLKGAFVNRLVLLVFALLLLSGCQDAQNVSWFRLEGQVINWTAPNPLAIRALGSNQPLLPFLGESTIEPDGRFQIDLRTPRAFELFDAELCDAPGERLEAKVVSVLGLSVEDAAGKPAGLIVMTNPSGTKYGRVFYAAQAVTVTPACRTALEESFVLPAGWSVLVENLAGQVVVADTVPDDMVWIFQAVAP